MIRVRTISGGGPPEIETQSHSKCRADIIYLLFIYFLFIYLLFTSLACKTYDY